MKIQLTRFKHHPNYRKNLKTPEKCIAVNTGILKFGQNGFINSRSSLIWVCTVCPDLAVQKLRIITVRVKSNVSVVDYQVVSLRDLKLSLGSPQNE